LPFQVSGPLYEAYSYAHVINQFQLLLFSGLAFFLLLGLLKRSLTISLDVDWFYRRLAPAAWRWVLYPILLAAEPFHKAIVHGIPAFAVKKWGHESSDHLPWGVGTIVMVCTLVLAAFLAIHYFE
jgi:multicomponent Na+:H+ antiporter subunit D